MFKENIINLNCGTIIKMRESRIDIHIYLVQAGTKCKSPISHVDKDIEEQSHITL